MAGIIRVLVGLVTLMFSLWLFAIVGPALLEPLVSIVGAQAVVATGPMAGDLNTIQQVTLRDAPLLLAVGFIVLSIVYAVFRELFTTPGRRV